MAFSTCVLPNAVKCAKVNYIDTSDFNLVFTVLGVPNTMPATRGKTKPESHVHQICKLLELKGNAAIFVENEVFPFTVGGCSTNMLNEYLYLRRLVAAETAWVTLCRDTSISAAEGVLAAAKDVMKEPFEVPAECTGMLSIQRNVPQYAKAAEQLRRLLTRQTPELEAGDLYAGAFCFVDTKRAVVVAADAAATACGMTLHKKYDSATLSTALGWVAMLDKRHTLPPKAASAITISRNAAMRTGTVIEEDKAVGDTVNSWFAEK